MPFLLPPSPAIPQPTEEDKTMFFMTCHGTFLGARQDGAIVQCPAAAMADAGGLFELDIAVDGEPGRFTRSMAGATDRRIIEARGRDGRGYEVHVMADSRTVALRRSGLFLCAIPGIEVVDACRVEAVGWELFLCLTGRDLADLMFILRNRWVVASTNALLPADAVGMEDHDYRLRLGGTVLDLRYNLPFMASERSPIDLQIMVAEILVDGWKIDRLHLYRPLVFTTAFKAEEYLLQAHLCLSSLLEFGLYDGAIHVISDHDRETFLSFVPGLKPDLLSVRIVEARDWVGYVASKYFVADDPALGGFQPILFIDPDVMADADLTPMLIAILTSSRLLAPLEVFSGLASNPSVGASLIQRAGLAPRFACGFNGGTLGIPNLQAHKATLTLIRIILVNHLDLHGRDSFQWVDQEVANYVSFVAGNFDTSTMLRFVRWGWEHCERDATHRQGLVHFFPSRGGMRKSEAMRLYTRTLRAANRALGIAARGG